MFTIRFASVSHIQQKTCQKWPRYGKTAVLFYSKLTRTTKVLKRVRSMLSNNQKQSWIVPQITILELYKAKSSMHITLTQANQNSWEPVNWENELWRVNKQTQKHTFYTVCTINGKETSPVNYGTQATAKAFCTGPGGGGGVLPEKLDGPGCAAHFPKPFPYSWPNSAIFLTLFLTGSNIRNPIYNLTLTSKSCFTPALKLVP